MPISAMQQSQDGSGMCTMIMNVSSDGITEVLKFNGEDFVSSKEILELIKQNDELYIQGLSLYDAVMESLEKDRAAPINFHNESVVAYQDKKPEGKLDRKVDADNSLSSSPSINSNALEVNLQHTETQPEINSQRMDDLISDNQISSKENVKLKQEIEAETTVKLERQGRDLKDKLAEERLKFNIEEPESEYEEFPEDMMPTLELTKDEDNEYNDDNIIEMLNGLKEKIHADGQRSLSDQFYILKGGVFSEPDNESCVPLEEKMTLLRSSSSDGGYGSDNGLSSNMSSIQQRSFNHQFYTLAGNVFSEPDSASQKKTELSRSLSFDSGLDSDEENCDNDLSSNISSISSVEKVAESKNVGNLLSSCII